MLTLEQLKLTKPGAMIASGQMLDNQDGLFMTGSGKKLKWIAVRGHSEADWAIYVRLADSSIESIKRSGDKVSCENNIKKCVPCDDEALAHYRR